MQLDTSSSGCASRAPCRAPSLPPARRASGLKVPGSICFRLPTPIAVFILVSAAMCSEEYGSPINNEYGCLQLRGLGLPRHGLAPCCVRAFTGAPGAASAAIRIRGRYGVRSGLASCSKGQDLTVRSMRRWEMRGNGAQKVENEPKESGSLMMRANRMQNRTFRATCHASASGISATC